mmetsp:Transcript_24868/g.81390  ORF Transcript_24868/g.81390 Transcript_24868/m.81390 type:complete len:288 (-) Transcript_24868:75-938(-)
MVLHHLLACAIPDVERHELFRIADEARHEAISDGVEAAAAEVLPDAALRVGRRPVRPRRLCSLVVEASGNWTIFLGVQLPCALFAAGCLEEDGCCERLRIAQGGAHPALAEKHGPFRDELQRDVPFAFGTRHNLEPKPRMPLHLRGCLNERLVVVVDGARRVPLLEQPIDVLRKERIVNVEVHLWRVCEKGARHAVVLDGVRPLEPCEQVHPLDHFAALRLERLHLDAPVVHPELHHVEREVALHRRLAPAIELHALPGERLDEMVEAAQLAAAAAAASPRGWNRGR